MIQLDLFDTLPGARPAWLLLNDTSAYLDGEGHVLCSECAEDALHTPQVRYRPIGTCRLVQPRECDACTRWLPASQGGIS